MLPQKSTSFRLPRRFFLALFSFLAIGPFAANCFGGSYVISSTDTSGTVTNSLPYVVGELNTDGNGTAVFSFGTASTDILFTSASTLTLSGSGTSIFTFKVGGSTTNPVSVDFLGGSMTLGAGTFNFNPNITWQNQYIPGETLLYGAASLTFGTISSTFNNAGDDDVFAINANDNIKTTALNGSIIAASNYGNAYGVAASSTGSVSITNLVSGGSIFAAAATGPSAVGIYAGTVTITTLDSVSSITASAPGGNAYGIEAENYVHISTLAGVISAAGANDVAAIDCHSGTVSIGADSGTLLAQSTDGTASGISSGGNVVITGTVSGAITATGGTGTSTGACGISSDGSVSIGGVSGKIIANGGSGDTSLAYGISSGGSVSIGTVTGTIAAHGGESGFATNDGISSGDGVSIGAMNGLIAVTSGSNTGSVDSGVSGLGDVVITTLNGTVSATSGNGGYVTISGISGGSVSIGVMSGLIAATTTGATDTFSTAYGISSHNGISINALSGTITANAGGGAFSSSYGLSSYLANVSIGTVSGLIAATGGSAASATAYGIYAAGAVNGGNSSTAMLITGTVSAAGANATAVQGNGIAIKLADGATLSAVSTAGTSGSAYAIRDIGTTADNVELQTGSAIIGGIELGSSGSNTLTLSAGTSTASGTLSNTISNAGTINVTGGEWTISGSVTGADNVNVVHGGELTVAGNINIAGDINVAAGGSLVFSAATASGTSTVNGDLRGVGTIGTLINNGTISPGASSSFGTLTVTNNYYQNPGSTLNIKIGGSGSSDKIAGSGLAVLNGGAVNIDGGQYQNTKPGDVYVFLTAGTVSGNTASVAVADDQTYTNAELVFGANYAEVLFVEDTANKFVTAAATPNQYAVAKYLDQTKYAATGDYATVLGDILALDGDGRRQAYDAMSGEIFGSMATVGIEVQEQFLRTISQRLQSQSLMRGDDGNVAASPRWNDKLVYVSDQDILPSTGLTGWAQGYGVGANLAADGNASGLIYSTAGVTIGLEQQFGADTVVGLGGGYSNTNVVLDARDDNGSISGGQLAFYLHHDFENCYATGIASYGYNSYTTNRYLAFGNVDRDAYAHYDGSSFSCYTEAGRTIFGRRIQLQPFAALEYIQLHQNDFTEANADSLDLVVGGVQASALRGLLGTRVFGNFHPNSDQTVTLEGRIAWRHEFLDESRIFDTSFDGQTGGGFAVTGVNVDRDAAVLGVGTTYHIVTTLAAFGGYNATVSKNFTSHAGVVGIQYTW
jgi:uncharacterized protein with beta-barrel porin domain